ncbi:MAG: hypothetical protein ONA90_01605 [candidate division KSB1 bacterium]|nr:hypothetical protein [candidate division KSB1 bacterium]
MSTTCQVDHSNVPGCISPPDPKLIAEGWERRFIADAKRAQDAIEMYGELGYDVRLAPVNATALSEACSGCLIAFTQFRAVYTRKKNKTFQ